MIDYIKEKQSKSGNKSGTKLVDLYRKYGKRKAHSMLRELHKSKVIELKQGVNGKLIFLKE